MELTEIFDQYGIEYRQAGEDHHAREGWVNVSCKICDGKNSGKFHMGFSLSGMTANCWKCGSHPSGQMLAELTGESLAHCMSLLKGMTVHVSKQKVERTGRLVEPAMIGELGTAHIRYLRRRKFNYVQLVRRWGLRGIGIAPSLQWRIYIPIHFQGEIVSWTTRTIGTKGTRYISAKPTQESIPLKNLLYGIDYVRYSTVVVEGPTDVWRLGPGAVATLGTGYSTAQVKALSRIPVRTIMFDAEPEAQRRARELAGALSIFPGVTKVCALDTGDVGDLSFAGAERIRERFLREEAPSRAITPKVFYERRYVGPPFSE